MVQPGSKERLDQLFGMSERAETWWPWWCFLKVEDLGVADRDDISCIWTAMNEPAAFARRLVGWADAAAAAVKREEG